MTRITLLMFAGALTLCGADPFIGSWKLDPARSTAGGETPKELTIRWEASGGGFKVSGQGVDQNGRKFNYSYQPVYDGKEYPPKGAWNWDSVANRQVDDYTREDTYKKDSKVIRVERRTVSKDAATLTYEIREGSTTSRLVLDRQP